MRWHSVAPIALASAPPRSPFWPGFDKSWAQLQRNSRSSTSPSTPKETMRSISGSSWHPSTQRSLAALERPAARGCCRREYGITVSDELFVDGQPKIEILPSTIHRLSTLWIAPGGAACNGAVSESPFRRYRAPDAQVLLSSRDVRGYRVLSGCQCLRTHRASCRSIDELCDVGIRVRAVDRHHCCAGASAAFARSIPIRKSKSTSFPREPGSAGTREKDLVSFPPRLAPDDQRQGVLVMRNQDDVPQLFARCSSSGSVVPGCRFAEHPPIFLRAPCTRAACWHRG